MKKLKYVDNYLVVKYSIREANKWKTKLDDYDIIDTEIYTRNLDTDKAVLEFDVEFDVFDSLEEAINLAKGFALPEEPEQPAASTPVCPHFPQIGEVLPNGDTVDAAYCIGANRYILAHLEINPDYYVVWDVDQNGDTINGRYFSDLHRAQNEFVYLCSDT